MSVPCQRVYGGEWAQTWAACCEKSQEHWPSSDLHWSHHSHLSRSPKNSISQNYSLWTLMSLIITSCIKFQPYTAGDDHDDDFYWKIYNFHRHLCLPQSMLKHRHIHFIFFWKQKDQDHKEHLHWSWNILNKIRQAVRGVEKIQFWNFIFLFKQNIRP